MSQVSDGANQFPNECSQARYPRITHRRDGPVHSRGRLLCGQRAHIIERAGLSWGVIQHHFGDRDGLLTAVIEDAVDRLTASLDLLADSAQVTDTEELVRETWEAFANPKAMAGLEILISTKQLRGALKGQRMQLLGTALAKMMARLDAATDGEHAAALGMLLWTTPVAMMIAEMFAARPLSTKDAQKAVAALIDAHR